MINIFILFLDVKFSIIDFVGFVLFSAIEIVSFMVMIFKI